MSTPLDPQTCLTSITSHPDIDGIGIRLATYCQLFIAILTLAFAPRRGISSWWTVIITSLGLQITAIVERKELSLYHALIVTWLTFPVFMMTFYYGVLAWGKRREEKLKEKGKGQGGQEQDALGEVVVGMVLHGSIFVGFCLWVWGTAPNFGDDTSCNPAVKFALFSLWDPTGSVRGFALFVMTLFALLMFFLNLILLTLFTNSCFNFFHSPFFTRIRSRFSKKPKPSPGRSSSSSSSPSTTPTNTNNTNLPPFLLALLNRLHSLPLPPLHTTVFVLTTVNLCSLILSITQIEAMIATNAQLLLGSTEDSEQNQWTFGQILSIILVANPLVGFWRVLEAEWNIGVGARTGDGVGAGRREGSAVQKTNVKSRMGSSRRKVKEGRRDEDDGEEGKEDLERLEEREEEEEDWESLRERPVAMLVVGVQRRWREARESGFTTISGLSGFKGSRFSWRSGRENGRERDEEYVV
ncbi:hypothetical protein K435DRAFT_109254 [Dendrothele bispora CBS 962.96]|uniref:Uncharacterized protein n=1 Tax=Dendrothele bispora (strain CBS 962.96) TaxID=1314807 RepID=A0A4V4HFS1_DENBC|nr:hypothetical protein K435DRAFT_109254 [Dendrothele bispora CBS 962.96]